MDFDFTVGLNSEELQALKELKSRISQEVKEEERCDDSLYLRYLRARDFNVNKAEEMLRNTLEWRTKEKIDDLIHGFELRDNFELYNYFPLNDVGFCREGHPVSLLDFGNFDFKGILKSCSQGECVNGVLYFFEMNLELMKSQSKKLGKPVQTWIFILDFENFTLAKATHKSSLELLIELFKLYESNYPERLKACFIINTTIYFNILFAVMKPLLSGNTLKKLRIFGKDGWKKELVKVMSPDILPVYYGGTRTDENGDPKCSAEFKYGREVPKTYYFRSPERRLAFQPGVKKYPVSRMSKVCITLDVTEPGSYIEWEFETENRDIGFGLYFQEPGQKVQKPKELIPKQRVESHLHSETGMFKCESSGTYILIFDNSYSWFSQKEVFCRATVVTPEGEKNVLSDS